MYSKKVEIFDDGCREKMNYCDPNSNVLMMSLLYSGAVKCFTFPNKKYFKYAVNFHILYEFNSIQFNFN